MPDDGDRELSLAERFEVKRKARKLKRARTSGFSPVFGWGGLLLLIGGGIMAGVVFMFFGPMEPAESAASYGVPTAMIFVGIVILLFAVPGPGLGSKRQGEWKGQFSHLAEMDEPGRICTKWTWRPWRWLRKGD